MARENLEHCHDPHRTLITLGIFPSIHCSNNRDNAILCGAPKVKTILKP